MPSSSSTSNIHMKSSISSGANFEQRLPVRLVALHFAAAQAYFASFAMPSTLARKCARDKT